MIALSFTISEKSISNFDFTRLWLENTTTAISTGTFSVLFGYIIYSKKKM